MNMMSSLLNRSATARNPPTIRNTDTPNRKGVSLCQPTPCFSAHSNLQNATLIVKKNTEKTIQQPGVFIVLIYAGLII